MIETKVRLSLNVPGAQLLSEQECSKNPKESYNVEVISTGLHSRKGKPRTITIQTRKQRTVKQLLNIPREAYDYMLDPKAPPTDKLNRKVYVKKVIGKRPDGSLIRTTQESTAWAQYQRKQRLEWHLSRIAESLGAISYTYEIIND